MLLLGGRGQGPLLLLIQLLVWGFLPPRACPPQGVACGQAPCRVLRAHPTSPFLWTAQEPPGAGAAPLGPSLPWKGEVAGL